MASRWVPRFHDLEHPEWISRSPYPVGGRVLGKERVRYDPDLISIACIIREDSGGEIVHVLLNRELQELFDAESVRNGDHVRISHSQEGHWKLTVRRASRFRRVRIATRAALLEALLGPN